ncbi:MAG: hypothetical protein AAB524_01725 [Patescibacteria group bacterium]
MATFNTQQLKPGGPRRSTGKKAAGIFIAIVLVILGIQFGIAGGLIGAALAGLVLKQFGVVGAGSAWVTETKGVRIAKYIVLAVVLVAIFISAFYLLK